MELWFLPIVFVVGTMIGATGLGGVALAPAMSALLGLPIHLAVAVAMASFVLSGAVGAAVYQARGLIEWRMVPLLSVIVAVSAFGGALMLGLIPEPVLRYGLAGLMVLVGLRALTVPSSTAAASSSATSPSPLRLATIGAATGWGSAVTATGGPLILIPLLLLFDVPIRAAIGLGQVVQIPIGLSATLGYALNGSFDLALTALVGVALAAGTAAGAALAIHISPDKTRKFVASALVLSGVAYAL